ncbi:hypothetical protein J4050_09400 [Winogradskyella sp. DF17]|uniref:Uncharacterized protein n=1 Tax=Winogradskyella pelagia TaxID=2819984 RepID=A0ABS3T2J6_9FLAO|nr:hypothetical protein [Winogradskyella sp. DF17]MBO3116963.1 hypothetical protein [Winogradskyella sp. DF17]
MRLFNAFRYNMLSKQKFGRYLLYALGETILVVIGILIALWVNRMSEDRNLNAQTQQTGRMVLTQMQKDVREIDSVLVDWDAASKVADTILRLTKKEEPIPITCQQCPSFVTGAILPTLSDRIPKIITNKTLAEGELLDLLNEIEFHYIEALKTSEFHENTVIEFTKTTLQYWQENFSWFADLSGRGNCPDDCLDYFYKSDDYRNRATYYELILLDSYYYEVDVFKERNQEFITRLEALLNKTL